MYKIVVFAALVAAATAAPGYLGAGVPLGLGHGAVLAAPALSVAHAPVAVAHAPYAVAHAPIAVAHAPVATSYQNSNLVSRSYGVHAIAAPTPVIVKSVAHPAVVAAPALAYGHGYGAYGHGYGAYGHGYGHDGLLGHY